MRLYDVHVRARSRRGTTKEALGDFAGRRGEVKGAVRPPRSRRAGPCPTPSRRPRGSGPARHQAAARERPSRPDARTASAAGDAFVAAGSTRRGASAEFLDARRAASDDDVNKLRDLLTVYGEFPEKYRLPTWRKVLRLPDNEKAYETLASKGVHPAMADLPDRFPISDRSLLLRLQESAAACRTTRPCSRRRRARDGVPVRQGVQDKRSSGVRSVPDPGQQPRPGVVRALPGSAVRAPRRGGGGGQVPRPASREAHGVRPRRACGARRGSCSRRSSPTSPPRTSGSACSTTSPRRRAMLTHLAAARARLAATPSSMRRRDRAPSSSSSRGTPARASSGCWRRRTC